MRTPGPIKRNIVVPRVPSGRPSQNLLLRSAGQAGPAAPGVVRRTRCAPMTKGQRDSTGAPSDWAKPQTLNPFSTPMTAAWSRTVTDERSRPISAAKRRRNAVWSGTAIH